MIETEVFFVEILKLIVLFAMVPAQFAWGLIATGSGLGIFLGVGMIISVYGGLITAIFRGALWLAAGRPAPKQRRRRRTS